ncbi:hypothetical protein SAMN05428974_0531 [Sphingopyxis sp. YR583]|uniref:MBL fold metallo-hydrolase n=1 Tax=Sphingopyxis sp. YR583 TaxID=1881047 RepID=UPI0008A782C7|nr:MBL fold metallo-hydrolase [Sphingopyxis sp. YR583]SEH12660.1 hypothetical protein SAMN05428974_0531 [Sphingopyxis sp. YR583]
MLPLLPPTEDYNRPPDPDEIEVTIIGPGFGETALVHIGDGQWIAIDSCTHGDDPAPAALRYFSDIGVDPASVFLIVVSHWDDDHIRGMADLATHCANARIAMSKAFIDKDFAAYVATHDAPLTQCVRAGVREIRRLLTVLKTTERTSILTATADRRIYDPSSLPMSHGEPVEIWTLAPCDYETDNFLLWAAAQMPSEGETRRVATRRLRNDLSVAVHLSIGDDAILLGGDLEEEQDPLTGWSAVLASTGRPQARAGLFKVPHHGSHTGEHPGVWSDMLAPEPVALVAPFRNGNVSLPAASDVTRISAYTPHAYASANLKALAPPPLDRMVQKTVELVAKRFTTIKPAMGLVRARKKAGSGAPWTVETFGEAAPLARVR